MPRQPVAREEIKGASTHLESLIYKFSSIRKQASAAEDHICELEEALARERDKFCKMLDTKDWEMTEVCKAM